MLIQKYKEWLILWRHFKRVQSLRLGWGEDAAPQVIEEALVDGLPVPPPHLIYLVGGITNANAFLHGGRRIGHAIREILERNQLPPEGFRAMLDFGCACGRGVRQWKDLRGPAIYGTDYNALGIRWCRANLPFAHFDVNGLRPPLRYADDTFDFVYAFSVFTHLTEAVQMAWMAEMRRVIAPGGHLLITLHGESFLPLLGQHHRDQFNAGQPVMLSEFAEGTNLAASFHPASFVRDRLAGESGFRVVDFVPEAVDQDFYLLRKQ